MDHLFLEQLRELTEEHTVIQPLHQTVCCEVHTWGGHTPARCIAYSTANIWLTLSSRSVWAAGNLSHLSYCWAREPGLLSLEGGWHHGGRAATGCTLEDWQGSVGTFAQKNNSFPTQSDALGSEDCRGWCSLVPLHCPCFSSSLTVRGLVIADMAFIYVNVLHYCYFSIMITVIMT